MSEQDDVVRGGQAAARDRDAHIASCPNCDISDLVGGAFIVRSSGLCPTGRTLADAHEDWAGKAAKYLE